MEQLEEYSSCYHPQYYTPNTSVISLYYWLAKLVIADYKGKPNDINIAIRAFYEIITQENFQSDFDELDQDIRNTSLEWILTIQLKQESSEFQSKIPKIDLENWEHVFNASGPLLLRAKQEYDNGLYQKAIETLSIIIYLYRKIPHRLNPQLLVDRAMARRLCLANHKPEHILQDLSLATWKCKFHHYSDMEAHCIVWLTAQVQLRLGMYRASEISFNQTLHFFKNKKDTCTRTTPDKVLYDLFKRIDSTDKDTRYTAFAEAFNADIVNRLTKQQLQVLIETAASLYEREKYWGKTDLAPQESLDTPSMAMKTYCSHHFYFASDDVAYALNIGQSLFKNTCHYQRSTYLRYINLKQDIKEIIDYLRQSAAHTKQSVTPYL